MKSLIRKEIKRAYKLNEEAVIVSDDTEDEKVLEKEDPKPEEIKKLPKEKLVQKDKEIPYGEELIIDIHNVEKSKFTAAFVKKFAEDLCDEIEMKRGPVKVWGTDSDEDDWKNPKADGISCVQFLYSSSIIIHAIDELGKVFINIFSCHNFDQKKAIAFASASWGGTIVHSHELVRK